MTGYGECETCAQSDKRYCIGCQRLLKTDGTYSRTGWIAKPGMTMAITSASLVYPAATKCKKEATEDEDGRGV